MDINEARCYDTAVCVDHLLIASVIFHFSDGLYLPALKDNVQNLVGIALCVHYTPVFDQNHLCSSCYFSIIFSSAQSPASSYPDL